MTAGGDGFYQPIGAELFLVRAGDFENAVGEEEEGIADGERALGGGVCGDFKEPQRRPGSGGAVFQGFDHGAIPPQPQRPGVSGVGIG